MHGEKLIEMKIQNDNIKCTPKKKGKNEERKSWSCTGKERKKRMDKNSEMVSMKKQIYMREKMKRVTLVLAGETKTFDEIIV